MSDREEFWKVTPDTVAGNIHMVKMKVRVCPTHRDWTSNHLDTQLKFCQLCGKETFEEVQELPAFYFYSGDIHYSYCKSCTSVLPTIYGDYCGNCGIKLTPEMVGTSGTV